MQKSYFLVFVSSGILIALAHTLIALAHPNSTEKLHRQKWDSRELYRKVNR